MNHRLPALRVGLEHVVHRLHCCFVAQDCWAPVPEQRPGFDVVVARLQDLLQQLKHAEVTATAAAAANRAAAAITAAATGAPMNTSG
jgi:hypothetical protein